MKLSHLKRGIKIGIRAIDRSAKQLEKEFAPLINAGHLTAKDAKAIATEAERLGRKARSKAVSAAKLEARMLLGKMGYMSKSEGDALKRRISLLEKKLKSKKRK